MTKSNHLLKWIPSVYFAMGMPFVMLSLVSVVMLKDMGVPNAQITFWTSLIILPWSLKPLWSPFLEIFRTKKYFVVGTQLITGMSFALLALSLPLPNFFTYSIALMGMIAFSGATHDIATDGIYMHELSTQTQAAYIGWQGAFFNIAKVTCNGGLVYLAGILMKTMGVVYAWTSIMAVCSGVMIVLSIYHSRVLPSGGIMASKIRNFEDGWKSFTEVFTTFFRKRNIGIYIIFIILYRLAEGLAIKVLPLFLKSHRCALHCCRDEGLGLSNEQFGLIVGTIGTVAFIVGSILAGHFVSKKGLRRTLFLLCCTINLPFLLYLLLAIYQPSYIAFTGMAIVCEYFGYGFGFVGLTLFMMQQVAPGKHKMAHYAFASGIMNLGYMFAGMVSGWLSDIFGYQIFFIIVAFAMIPALIIARVVPFGQKDENLER